MQNRGMRPLVTTIIPVFNRPAMLREAVASVLAQTYQPIEVILVDDGSTDDTPLIAAQLAAAHGEIRVMRQENGGPGVARETGRNAARGEFVQHLDSDDLIEPRKFELQVEGLLAHPQCDVSYGWTRHAHIDGRSNVHPAKRTGERHEAIFPKMLESRWWETATPLYRTSLLRKAGPWLPLRIEEDWEYDARLGALGAKLHFVETWLCTHRSHDVGRLSGGAQTPAKLHDRAIAHEAVLRHGQKAGIPSDAPEMDHFARELFLLARQCGASGLRQESRRLFALAREASAHDRAALRLYAAVAKTIGWTNAGKLSAMLDAIRR
jgi:hypothetical protein